MKRSLRKMLRPAEKKEPQGVNYQGVGDSMDDSFKVPRAIGGQDGLLSRAWGRPEVSWQAAPGYQLGRAEARRCLLGVRAP
jgi:hypothetical protein